MASFLVNYFLFRPATAADYWEPPPPGLAVQDVELITPSATRLHAWWAAPSGWTPAQGALLYCHGNAGNLSLRGPSMQRWQKTLGTAVLVFDYPGYGKSGGRPSEAGCYAAVDAAYRWLTSVSAVPGERVVLYGGLLGAAVALDLAVRRPHRGSVLVSAFTSVQDMARREFPWLPSRWLVRGAFDNLSKVGRTGRPVFVAHGTADRLVPFSHGERLFAAAREPRRFFPMPGLDHDHAPTAECLAAVKEFLDAHAPR